MEQNKKQYKIKNKNKIKLKNYLDKLKPKNEINPRYTAGRSSK
jgi:hypothetical protein